MPYYEFTCLAIFTVLFSFWSTMGLINTLMKFTICGMIIWTMFKVYPFLQPLL